MQEIVIDLEKKDNFLESIYRLRLVTNQEMLSHFAEDDVEFTSEEYENAMHNKDQLEVIMKGFDRSID